MNDTDTIIVFHRVFSWYGGVKLLSHSCTFANFHTLAISRLFCKREPLNSLMNFAWT
jgi:hypothetical protein